jgi:septum site-determining protein MinD
MMTVEDVLEILAIPLLGIVNESPDVLTASNVGCPITLHNPTSAAARAYDDAARRLMGETVPLHTPRQEKQGFISRLFGRKAAA